MIRPLVTLLAFSLGLPALGQESARIVAKGNSVEITDVSFQSRSVFEPLEEGDRVRTGPASFVVIDVEPGIRLTLSPDSVVGLESLDALPSIRLEQGRVRVRTDAWSLRVESPVGDFLVSEAPGEADFELSGSGVILQVLSGALTMENVNTDAVVFRAPGARAARVYQVGSTIRRGNEQENYPYFPNIYVGYPQPFPYGAPPRRHLLHGPAAVSDTDAQVFPCASVVEFFFMLPGATRLRCLPVTKR